ncbi:MAG: recombination mediator RecR [Candidatus Puniceispirillaceae bacterium]
MAIQTPLDQLIKRLARLPGFGPRSARRAALHLLKHKQTMMIPLAEEMAHVAHQVRTCVDCGNLDMNDKCQICLDSRRDDSRICVLEDVADLWAMERAGVFSGRYFVLGGTLSALEGRGPAELGIDRLINRITAIATQADKAELILATSATVDGQTTAHYIAERVAELPVTVSRLAHGLPVGGELNYLDEGTLAQAMRARTKL